MSNKIRFAVTGATGFIGQALCSELLRQGFSVHAYGRKRGFKVARGMEYSCVKNYLEVQGDAGTVCVHLAGESSVSALEKQSEAALSEAIVLARHVCDQRFARVIFASSAAVYGDRSRVPHREDESLNICGAYGRLKRAVEEVALEKRQSVARIANVYGAGMSKANVLSGILEQLAQSGPIKVRCSMPVRDFIHVTDVVRGLIGLAITGTQGIFNLGTGIGTDIAGLAAQALAIAGQSERAVCCANDDHIHSSIVLDPSKMKVQCGWSARIGLREGLQELVDLNS